MVSVQADLMLSVSSNNAAVCRYCRRETPQCAADWADVCNKDAALTQSVLTPKVLTSRSDRPNVLQQFERVAPTCNGGS